MITTIYSDPDFLEHHGVKGMKWGVRRYQNPDGTRIKTLKKKVYKSYNAAQKKVNTTIDSHETLKKVSDKAKAQANKQKEITKDFADKHSTAGIVAIQAGKSFVYGMGTLFTGVALGSLAGPFAPVVIVGTNAALNIMETQAKAKAIAAIGYKYNILHEDSGGDEMIDTIYSDPDFLEHHGVKGMKWGVRRYQNYDGTRIGAKSNDELKAANKRSGLERTYMQNKSDPVKEMARNTRDAAYSTKNTTRGIESLRQKSKKAQREKAAREAAMREKLKGMSDDELRNAINRMRMEREYSSLTSKEVRSGWDTTRDILDIVGGVASVGLAVAGFAGAMPLLLHEDFGGDVMIDTIYSDPDFLEHHGVKGMHWGVRKDKERNASDRKRMKEARKEYKVAKKQYNKDFNKYYRQASGIHITQKGRRKTEKLQAQALVSSGKMWIAKGKYMQAKGVYKGNNKKVEIGKIQVERASNNTKLWKTVQKDINNGYSAKEAVRRNQSMFDSTAKKNEDLNAKYRRIKENG